MPRALHVKLRDGWGSAIPVELFCVQVEKLAGKTHFIGIREFCDFAPAPMARTFQRPAPRRQRRQRSARGTAADSSSSSDSGSNGSGSGSGGGSRGGKKRSRNAAGAQAAALGDGLGVGDGLGAPGAQLRWNI